jgi:hypothetical protein
MIVTCRPKRRPFSPCYTKKKYKLQTQIGSESNDRFQINAKKVINLIPVPLTVRPRLVNNTESVKLQEEAVSIVRNKSILLKEGNIVRSPTRLS